MSPPTDAETAAKIRDKRGMIALRASLAGVVVFLTIIGVSSLVYLVSVASQINQVQNQIADSATDQRARTAQSVQQIIDQLNTLDQSRTLSASGLAESQAQIRAALKRLCAAQGITCPSLGAP